MLLSCAATPTEHTTALVQNHGFHHVNSVVYDDRLRKVGSSAAVSGSPRQRVDPDQLILRERLELGPVKVNIYTLSEVMSPVEGRVFSAVSEGSELRAVLSSALVETIEPMARVMSKGLRIELVVVPNKSGAFITLLSDVATSPLPLAFLAPIFPEHELGGDSIQSFWLQQTTMIAHELLHLEHSLAGLESHSKLEMIDEETAASLMSWCAEARFNRLMSSSNRRVFGKFIGFPSAQYFPGIFRGDFAPDAEQLQSARHVSSVGKEVARAIVFHLVADGATTINLADPEITAPLYALCDKLPASRPRFTIGEIP